MGPPIRLAGEIVGASFIGRPHSVSEMFFAAVDGQHESFRHGRWTLHTQLLPHRTGTDGTFRNTLGDGLVVAARGEVQVRGRDSGGDNSFHKACSLPSCVSERRFCFPSESHATYGTGGHRLQQLQSLLKLCLIGSTLHHRRCGKEGRQSPWGEPHLAGRTGEEGAWCRPAQNMKQSVQYCNQDEMSSCGKSDWKLDSIPTSQRCSSRPKG
jgi:hypothetical protein